MDGNQDRIGHRILFKLVYLWTDLKILRLIFSFCIPGRQFFTKHDCQMVYKTKEQNKKGLLILIYKE